MDPLTILLILGIGYLVLKPGALGSLGLGSILGTSAGVPSTLPRAAPVVTSQQLLPGTAATSGFQLPSSATGPSTPTTIGSGIATSGAAGAGLAIAGASVATAAITAGIGAIVAIGIGLEAAHQRRKQQAKDENSAMNLAISGFDQDIRAVNHAFNLGQISRAQVIQLMQTLKTHYWDLTCSHIQPGRNGCNCGTNCAPASARRSNYCSGSIGAVCCAGCAQIIPSADEVIALMQGQYGKVPADPQAVCPCPLDSTGIHWRSIVRQIFGSQYGGAARGPYTLDWVGV